MRFSTVALLGGLASVARAHFQLQYPVPRGPFVEDNEPTFCDGYNDAVNNRTVFPLSNGIINLNSEHPQWTAGVIVSTKADPTSFGDFNNSAGTYQLVVQYFQQSGEGKFCFPIDLAANSNVTGLTDGANVTIQVIFNGGDGNLYQCADLTLSGSVSVPANATSSCTNTTSTPSTSSTAPSTSQTGGAAKGMMPMSGFAVGALGLALSIL
ncbi:hypothetical protein BV22DRAFT_1072662 [Leucogyrophana mollusca]|uniref:Uncharacterized protein n=1 Tax=Leucogyrophana mollusca TaxID=85980 RepID=A0ACB8B6H3_9AGAM|nr:hypothetical protein BV22DRAFT_1072662 [Leucogyrophana mollusca]